MEVYIHNLIENIPKREKPLHVDIVMEGGAFNVEAPKNYKKFNLKQWVEWSGADIK